VHWLVRSVKIPLQLRRDVVNDALHREISALSREQREIVVLKDLNGFQYSEIAAVLSIPIGTVMSRLYRGCAVLQARLLTATGPRGNAAFD
jgi:RNA polymerase sigma-70 factor, ECF subfamily